MNRNIEIMNNISNKIDNHLNMPDMQETSKYAQICKIKLHIFNRSSLNQMSMSSSIK